MGLKSWAKQPTTPRRIAFSEKEQAITCLSMLLEEYDYSISASEIRKGRPLEQCQYKSLTHLAQELGFCLTEEVAGSSLAPSKKHHHRIIDHETEGTVLLTIEENHIWIVNPYKGIRTINDHDQRSLLRQSKGLRVDEEKLNPTLKRKRPSLLWNLLLTDRSLYSVGAVIVLISLIHGLVTLLDPIIKNIYFTNVVQMGIYDWARSLAILYFAVAVLGGVLLLAGSALSLVLSSRLALRWSFNTYTAMLRLPLLYLRIRSKGDLMNRVRASERLGSFIGSDEIMLIASALNLILLLIVLFSTSIPLALVLVFVQACSFLFLLKTNGGWKSRADALQQQSALETGSFVNLIGNMNALHQQKITENAFRIHQLVVNRRARAQQGMSLYTIFVHFGSSSIDIFQSVLLLTMATLLIMEGQINLGEYIAFQAVLASVIVPAKRIAKFISSFQALRATYDRIQDMIEESKLQQAYGISDKTQPDELLTVTIYNKTINSENQDVDSAMNRLSIKTKPKGTCLIVKSLEQKHYLEAALAGEHLLPESININIAHRDGSRRLLVARSTPYLYPGTVSENITLGIPAGQDSVVNNLNELATIAGWRPEQLANDVQELANKDLELRILSIMRALWSGGDGIIVSNFDHPLSHPDNEIFFTLLEKIKSMGIPIIFLTSQNKIKEAEWGEMMDITSMVEAMIDAGKKGMPVS